MPRVADYSILIDEWWTEGFGPSPIEFTVPNNINNDSRSILGFKLRYWNEDDMVLTVKLNSVSVWHWRVPSTGDTSFRYIQEVIPKGLAVPGANRLTAHSDSDDFRSVGISDVVLWWQADI